MSADPIRGWVVVDRETNALDWDGELHPTLQDAENSRDEANGDLDTDPSQTSGVRHYEVLPVLREPLTNWLIEMGMIA